MMRWSWISYAFLVGASAFATTLVGYGVSSLTDAASWIRAFVFERTFVQWALLFVFFIGLIYLACLVPHVVRNARYGAQIAAAPRGTLPVKPPERWQRVLRAREIDERQDLAAFLSAVRDKDQADTEIAYRLPTDIVQLLPLIGFFGTVFGLSTGLYGAFLGAGELTPRVFASAIAIAFDNTLLGLALTIILFSVNGLIRKADERSNLRIESFGAELLQRICLDGAADRASDPATASLSRLSRDTARLADALPDFNAAMERTAVVTDAVAKAVSMAVDRHAAIVDRLGDLERALRDSRSDLDRVEALVRETAGGTSVIDEILGKLQKAIADRNRELVQALTRALRRPRQIIIQEPDNPASERDRDRFAG